MGWALPETTLGSAQLEVQLGLEAGWIERRTGIRSRRVLAEGEQLSSLALSAAQRALAGATRPRVDAILTCSSAPETPMPSLASRLALELGADPCLCCDLAASSAGFLHGLVVAEGLLKAGRVERVLLVAAEALSRRLDWQDRETCVLFGDGAAAALLAREPVGKPLATVEDLLWGSDGAGRDALMIGEVAAGDPAPPLTMRGKRVFLAGVRRMAEALQRLAERAELSLEALARVVPHQANARLLEALAARLELPRERFIERIADVGNLGAASLPLTLAQAAESEELVAGEEIALVAFGAGYVWSAARLRWGGESGA